MHERKTLIDACEGTGPVKKLTLLFPPLLLRFLDFYSRTLFFPETPHSHASFLLLLHQHHCTRSPP